MAKDQLGHGSNARGVSAVKAALASGPKSAPAPIHDSMAASIARGSAMRSAGDGGHVPGFPAAGTATHNAQGHAWGSPEALADFKAAYGRGKAAGNAKNRAEGKAFRSGKSEINRLRKQGK